jgi:hypothetical protein
MQTADIPVVPTRERCSVQVLAERLVCAGSNSPYYHFTVEASDLLTEYRRIGTRNAKSRKDPGGQG